jgi:Carboxypeptidase regulatory-like domain
MHACFLRRTGLSLLVFCCAFFLCRTASAQTTTADVVGTVTDTSGAVVPGATVTMTNVGTNVSQTTVSNASGDYVFTLLQVGNYSEKVEAKGFKTFLTPSLALSAGDRARVDAKLEVGDVTQTVEVSGSVAPALQTDTATIGALVTAQAVEDVPLDGRNVTKLVQLAPGVNQGSPNDLMSGARPDDRRQTAAFSANGQTDAVNNLTVDGIDNNDAIIGTTIVRPSVDAIQEVNVQTNLYDASVTRSAGAVVDVISKSGSNAFHGSAYEFFRNAVLNTNPNHAFPSNYNCSTNPCTLNLTKVLPKPAFRQNQYGGSVGGPIKKDKTFFFGDFEQLKKGLGIPITATVPTACNRGTAACPDGKTAFGDFSDQPDISPVGGGASACQPSSTNQATCPYTLVQPQNVSQMGLEYMLLYPLPTTSGIANNYTGNPNQIQNSSTFDVRVDQHFSDSDTLFVRYSFNDVTTLTPDAFPEVTLGSGNATIPSNVALAQPTLTIPKVTVWPSGEVAANNFAGPAKERAQGLALSYVHVFSTNFVLNLKAGFTRLSDNVHSLNAGSNAATAMGFPCNSVSCISQPGSSGIPNIVVSAWTPLGDATFLPILYEDNTFQYNANFTWNKNAHSVRFGVVLIRRREAQGQSNNGEGGFTFSGGYTGFQGADLLEGLAAGAPGGTADTRSYSLVTPNQRQWQPGAFIQDDWRTTHWLTLNLGVRYDIFAPLTEKDGRISNFNPATGLMSGPGLPGLNQTGPTALILTKYHNVAPRVGFAATLKHNMVIRGGYGITFFQNRALIFKNAPYNFSFSCQAQNVAQSNSACTAPFANSSTVEWGPVGSTSSLVPGPTEPANVGTGGGLFGGGLPLPVLSQTQVLPPATCPAGTALPATALGCSALGGNQYASITVSSSAPNFLIPYLQQFNLELQKEWKGNVFHIGYIGELGRHYSENGNTTAIPFTTVNNYIVGAEVASYNATTNPTGLGIGNPLAAQYPWLAHSTVSMANNLATTSYNALELALQRRFSNGLTVNVNYTWDQSLQNGNGVCHAVYSPADFGFGTGAKYINPCFYDNPKSTSSPIVETSLVDGPGQLGHPFFFTPNRIAGTVNYELPFAKTAEGILGAVAKGWAVNAAGYWQSGLAFNITNGAAFSGTGGNGIVVGGGLDQVCSGKLSNPTLAQWINPACFTQPTGDTYGDADYAQELGPRQRNLDFSLFKEFALTERVRMQFRAEIFNLFNIVNYAPPTPASGIAGNGTTSVSIPAFTTSAPKSGTGAGSCGTANGVTLVGSCGAGLAVAPGTTGLHVGSIIQTNPNNNSREVQFGLKFLF